MIQILELGVKWELLEHFFPERDSLISVPLMKRKSRYITHNETIFED
jgi:hypothetical protein